MTKKELKHVEEPNELTEDDYEVLESGEPESDEKQGAKESFEDSKPRPNEKEED